MYAVKPTFSTKTFPQPERYTSVSARAFIKGYRSIRKNLGEKKSRIHIERERINSIA